MFLTAGHRVVDYLLVGMEEPLARVAQGVECPSLDQRLDRPLVEHHGVAALREVVEVSEGSVGGPFDLDQLHQPLTHVAHCGEPEDDPTRRLPRPSVQRGHRLEIRTCHVDVRYVHDDAQHPALVQVHGGLVQVRLDACQQGRQVLHRIVGLEIGDLVGDQAVAVRMALVEGVVGELLDDVEQFLAQGRAVAGGVAAAHEGRTLLLHELPYLLATGLPEVVGLCQRVASELLGDPHHRFLVDHEAVGVGQEFLGIRVEVVHRLPAVLSIGIVVVHVGRHRPGPVEGHQGGHVLEARRGQRTHQGTHRAGLQLEHPYGVAPGQHLEGRPVVQVHVVDVDDLSADPIHVSKGVGDHIQVPEAQEVHLE